MPSKPVSSSIRVTRKGVGGGHERRARPELHRTSLPHDGVFPGRNPGKLRPCPRCCGSVATCACTTYHRSSTPLEKIGTCSPATSSIHGCGRPQALGG